MALTDLGESLRLDRPEPDAREEASTGEDILGVEVTHAVCQGEGRPPASESAARAAESCASPVELLGPDLPPVVLGKSMDRLLTPAEYEAVGALVGAFPRRRLPRELAEVVECKDPVSALRDLRKQDPRWRRVIDPPVVTASARARPLGRELERAAGAGRWNASRRTVRLGHL